MEDKRSSHNENATNQSKGYGGYQPGPMSYGTTVITEQVQPSNDKVADNDQNMAKPKPKSDLDINTKPFIPENAFIPFP